MKGSTPFSFDDDGEAKRHAPATERNREAIAEILYDILPESGTVLEIASGTGEHVVYFARKFQHLSWQPSDADKHALRSITAWSADSGAPNLLPPIHISAETSDWPIAHADAILCINMVHISPWSATQGLFAGAARILPAGAPLYLYGPYIQKDIPTAQSNLDFDASLRARNPDWGLRNLADVQSAAEKQRLVLRSQIQMPANNLSLIFSKNR